MRQAALEGNHPMIVAVLKTVFPVCRHFEPAPGGLD